MKNVILTHKELQAHLFEAFTFGLQQVSLGNNYIISDSTNTHFVWKIVQGGAAMGKELFTHHICKGDYEMNDVRLGVTTAYLKQRAVEFLNDFENIKRAESKPPKSNIHGEVIAGDLFLPMHLISEVPKKPEPGSLDKNLNKRNTSNYVLIDPDGLKQNFFIGFYNFQEEKWFDQNNQAATGYIDVGMGRWFDLPNYEPK